MTTCCDCARPAGGLAIEFELAVLAITHGVPSPTVWWCTPEDDAHASYLRRWGFRDWEAIETRLAVSDSRGLWLRADRVADLTPAVLAAALPSN